VLATLTVGVTQAVLVFVALVLYQELESRLIVPRIYGQALRLSPVAVTLALLVGGALLGIVGALLALPLAAGIRVLIEDLRIELPGEVPGEATERSVEEDVEVIYEQRTAGAPAIEAAQVAGELAAQVDARVKEEAGGSRHDEVPIEQRQDPRAA
jgi:hypothetical protein